MLNFSACTSGGNRTLKKLLHEKQVTMTNLSTEAFFCFSLAKTFLTEAICSIRRSFVIKPNFKEQLLDSTNNLYFTTLFTFVNAFSLNHE